MHRPLFDLLKRLLMAGLLLAAFGVGAAGIDGQHFDDRIRLADTELQLNGLGLRAVAWIKGYAAGLYLTQTAGTPVEVLAVPGPKRIRLRMMLDVDA
ncbi:MAG TPA: chalcone isomerase family protein, partial [Albitalea sp.]|nr:chalcone isomerase family protein [Albitalea sp.]